MGSLRSNRPVALVVLGVILSTSPLRGESKEQQTLWESSQEQGNLIELYSSEGCSSCPPADRLLSDLRRNSQLWKTIFPVVFHVDYWNSLGWVDPFSQSRFTLRQRAYSLKWKRLAVYTPAFILNGAEVRPASESFKTRLSRLGPKVGKLKVKLQPSGDLLIEFQSLRLPHEDLKVSVAVLGNGFKTHVKSGENMGKTLKHEFIVLKLIEEDLIFDQAEKNYQTKVSLSLPQERVSPKSYSFVSWVSEAKNLTPLQVVGGDLPTTVFELQNSQKRSDSKEKK